MKKGDKVSWTSHTGKRREGTYVCDFISNPLSMVIGDWDERVHRIHKTKLKLGRWATRTDTE